MLLTLLVLLQSSAPAEANAPRDIAVISVSRRGRSAGDAVAAEVVKSLRARGLKVTESHAASRKILENSGVDPQSCDGTRVCVRHLAQLLGPRAVVVGIDVARAGSGVAAHVEALAADEGSPLAQLDFSGETRTFSTRFTAPVQRFGSDVASALARLDVPGPDQVMALSHPVAPSPPAGAAAEPIAAPSAPPKVVAVNDGFAHWPGGEVPLDDPPLTTPPVTLTASTHAHWPKWTLLTGTLVAALTTAGFTIAGFQERATYQSMLRDYGGGHDNASAVPRSVLEQHASNANTDFIGALIALAATVPLAIGTAWLFASEPK